MLFQFKIIQKYRHLCYIRKHIKFQEHSVREGGVPWYTGSHDTFARSRKLQLVAPKKKFVLVAPQVGYSLSEGGDSSINTFGVSGG